MSAEGVPLEIIADLCGHAGTAVTEQVCRYQLKPVITAGAVTMNTIFKDNRVESPSEQPACGGSPIGSRRANKIEKGLRNDLRDPFSPGTSLSRPGETLLKPGDL